MKKRTLLCLSIVALSGCVDALSTQDLALTSSDAPIMASQNAANTSNVSVPPQISVLVSENGTTNGTTINYTLTTTQPVQATLRLDGAVVSSEEVASTRTWALPLSFGRSLASLVVEADGFKQTDQRTLVRMAATTLVLDFNVFHPDHGNSDHVETHTVWIDVDARPSTAAYQNVGVPHYDAFTLHDQLQTFENMTKTVIEYVWSASFKQYSVSRIDEAGSPLSSSSPPWWCYTVNGKTADGITIQKIMPGDLAHFELGGCA